MKKHLTVISMLGLVWIPPVVAGQEVIEEIVAVVNDEIITLTQAREQYNAVLDQLRSQELPPEEYDKQRETLKNELLEAMITDILLLQKAEEQDLNVTEQLRTIIENIKKENNLATDEDLRRALQQQGMTLESWRHQYEQALLRQAVIYSEVERFIVLDDAEIVQYYRQHPDEFKVPTEFELRAVYLAQGSRNPDDLENVKSTISKELEAGTGFPELASRYSDPPLNETEGELGRFKKGELDKTLEEAVDKLKTGEVSPWIEARNGWYLLKVEERIESFLQPFEEIRETVQQRLFNERRELKLTEYLKTIKEQSYIKIIKPDPWDY
jgi:parvulin-like peptidyl-prolyl isomerase